MILVLLAACAARSPADLDDAIDQVGVLTSDEDRAALRSGERDAVDMHFGLGLAIRNEWRLWGRSRLARWFRDRGVTHADDMSSVILESYVRTLRGVPVDLEGQIAVIRSYWARHGQPEPQP